MANMTVPASSDTESDTAAPATADPTTAIGPYYMELEGAAEVNQANAPGDSSTNPPLSVVDRVERETSDATLIS